MMLFNFYIGQILTFGVFISSPNTTTPSASNRAELIGQDAPDKGTVPW